MRKMHGHLPACRDGVWGSRHRGFFSRRQLKVGASVGAATLAVGLAACTSSPTQTAAAAGNTGTAPARATGTVVVFAATSLTAAFNDIAAKFEKANPGVHVNFNYNGSSTLATQITQGAPADVFASAAPSNMATLTDANLTATSPKTFATNTGEIIVEAGNPHHITSLDDLAHSGVKVVTCAPAVPCGQIATAIFENAGITVRPVSQEQNVGGVITKVTLGEADAGIVYETDVKANGDKTAGVPIPAYQNATTDYPIAEVKGAKNAAGAAAFISYVVGPEGQQVLKSFGFLPPGS
jgi:molybdate transport system substrate-binding protein